MDKNKFMAQLQKKIPTATVRVMTQEQRQNALVCLRKNGSEPTRQHDYGVGYGIVASNW